MTIEPNKLFLEYLQRVLPLFTDKFSNKAIIHRCGIESNNNFYIDVDYNIHEEVGNYINLTKLFFIYHYLEYKIYPTFGNRFALEITTNVIDKQIISDNFFFIEESNGFIPQGYYKVSKVKYDTENNKTMIHVDLGSNISYFNIKANTPTINLYTDYGNTLSGYNGLREIKKIEDIVISNIKYKRITLVKDIHFNFTVNSSDFVCLHANLHYSLHRIVHAIPSEFQEYSLKNYIQSKENVLVVNIENARTDEGSFDYFLNHSKQVYIPMRYTLEMYVFLYRNRYDKGEEEKVPDIYDNISDIMHDVTTKVISVCALYKEMMGKKINNGIIGSIQNMNGIGTPSVRQIGNIGGNMQTYLITMDVDGSIFAFNSNILKEQGMIKEIQGNLLFETFHNIL